jgi:hypothetical protein
MITDAYALIMHMIKFLIVFNIRDVISTMPLSYTMNLDIIIFNIPSQSQPATRLRLDLNLSILAAAMGLVKASAN